MIEFQNSIDVNIPVSEVFYFISHFENLSKWNYYVMDVSKITPGPVGPGTTYHQKRKNDEQDFRVKVYEPMVEVEIETLPPERKLRMRFRLKPEGKGTRIIDQWELESGLPGFLEPLASGKTRNAVFKNLQKLKELLETGKVILQDGRKINYQRGGVIQRT